MNVLEKILEEIEEKRESLVDMSDDEMELCDVEDWYDEGVKAGRMKTYLDVAETIRSHMDEVSGMRGKRLIDANALDEEVRNFFLTIIGDPSQAMVVRECKESFRRIIDEQPTVYEANDWIPVEEKLPEEKGWYQCTCSDKEIWNDDIVRDLYYYPEIKEFVDNIRYEANGLKDIEKYYWTKYVTAWQFQPKPYKKHRQ